MHKEVCKIPLECWLQDNRQRCIWHRERLSDSRFRGEASEKWFEMLPPLSSRPDDSSLTDSRPLVWKEQGLGKQFEAAERDLG